MNRDRIWGLIWIGAVAAVVVLGSLLGIAPKVAEAKAAVAELTIVQEQNAQHEAALVVLQEEYAQIASLKNDLVGLQRGIPLAADIPTFLAQLDSVAAENAVTLEQISVSDGAGYIPVELPTTAGTDDAESAGEAAEDSSPAPGEASARLSTANYISVPITIEASGTGDTVLDFLSGLQYGQRIIAINTFALSSGTSTDTVTVSISAEIYVLVDPFAEPAL